MVKKQEHNWLITLGIDNPDPITTSNKRGTLKRKEKIYTNTRDCLIYPERLNILILILIFNV